MADLNAKANVKTLISISQRIRSQLMA